MSAAGSSDRAERDDAPVSSQPPRSATFRDTGPRSSPNIAWQALDVTKAARAALAGQSPRCVWFTGLPGAGKSTLANLLERRLHAAGRHTYLLDGDNLRYGLNGDLGFSERDRAENVRRVAEVSKLMVDAGLVVLVSLVSPYRVDRQAAREIFEPFEFVEVHLATPLEECERRDPKGLYARARAGRLPGLTGVDAPYEAPDNPEVRLDTSTLTPAECVEALAQHLRVGLGASSRSIR